MSETDKWLKCSSDVPTKLLLNWKRIKGDSVICCENNMVNRMVLGLPAIPLGSTLPGGELNTKLEAYQKRDVEKLLSIGNVLNANPMGLGKTPETVELLRQAKAKKILIVAPKIIRQQWVDQLKLWGDFDAQIYEKQNTITPGVWVINYDKLRNETVRLKFKAFVWDYLVLDEAHKIKNKDSQQSKAVKAIPATHRVALTGTPILRYIDDLWSILHFLDWHYSGSSYWAFVKYFCKIAKTPWGNKIEGITEDTNKFSILQCLLDRVSVRNNALEVAHGKTIEVVRLPMPAKMRNLYNREKALLLDELPDSLTIPNGAVLTLRLMQTTSWPGLYLQGEAGPKFEWILEQCKNNPEEKFVVFSRFSKTVHALQRYLTDNDVSSCTITGDASSESNELSRRLFTERSTQVLAGTIGSMGQGYDGLQKVCRLMVFIDRDWSPEILAQAEDRLRRRGQDNPVSIYYLECSSSFDQHVGKINCSRASDIKGALQSDD